METSSIVEREESLIRMMNAYKPERMVYLGTTIVSLIMLLVSTCILIWNSRNDGGELAIVLPMMFGSSGIIGYTANRSLHMWEESIKRLIPSDSDEEN